ncbi:MAG: hypothetical protein ACRDRX_11240 [Pseudonocardiaceae bacterium]
MTRASTAATPVEEPVPVTEPYRIGLFRRYRLRWLGRSDGRLAMPDPCSAKALLTTPTRDHLLMRHDLRVVTLWKDYQAEHPRPDPKIVLVDEELSALRQALQAARRELEAARRSPPDPSNPQFSPGEQRQHRSAEAVSQRREQEHQQLINDLERRVDSAADSITGAEGRRAELEKSEVSRLGGAVLSEYRLIATFKYERSIYDTALQRRHPLRELLRGRLDPSVPELSSWARAALIECGE